MARTLEAIGIMVALFTMLGVMLPRTSEAEKSIVIHASVQEVFEEVNNLKNWERWSPWLTEDPNIKLHYEGPATGLGAKVRWTSEDPRIGNAYQEIISVTPCKEIVLTWDTEGNYEPATTTWTFEELKDGRTKVTWDKKNRVGFNVIKKYINLGNTLKVEKILGAGLRRLRRQMEYYNKREQEEKQDVSQEGLGEEPKA